MEELLGSYKFAQIRLDSEDEARLQRFNTDGLDNTNFSKCGLRPILVSSSSEHADIAVENLHAVESYLAAIANHS